MRPTIGTPARKQVLITARAICTIVEREQKKSRDRAARTKRVPLVVELVMRVSRVAARLWGKKARARSQLASFLREGITNEIPPICF